MIKFGTGGWRAVIGDDFTKDNVKAIANALGKYAHKNNKTDTPIVIGYDNRFLSKEAANWFAEELITFEIDVEVMTESVPTPYVMYDVMHKQYHFGVMITASHNPYNYNGIKLIVDEGRDAPVEVTKQIEYFCNNCCTLNSELLMNGQFTYIDPNYESYKNFINTFLPLKDRFKCKSKILFNPMHGSGYNAFRFICGLSELPTINQNIDPYFDFKLPAPNSKSLSNIINMVHNGDIYDTVILSFDGDGDRLGVIDEEGRYIDMNKLMTLFYWYLHEYKHLSGAIIKNCVTSSMLDEVAKYYNEECIEVPVGFKYISDGMKKHNALMGGESSGGATFSGYINGKDAIFSATLLIEILTQTDSYLCELIDKMDKMFGGKTFCEASISYDKEHIDKIKMFMSEINNKINTYVRNSGRCIHFYTIDGYKWCFENKDWISIRFSGTEPIIRIMGEFDDTSNWDNSLNKFEYELNNIM